MPDISRISRTILATGILVCPIPLAVTWALHHQPVSPIAAGAVPEIDGSPDSPILFNGFPYIRVSGSELTAKRAVATFSDLVAKQEKELGRSHPDTLISRNNLANALLAEGRFTEAEVAQRSLLTDMEESLTPGHPDAFRCRFNLALNLRMQGKVDDARREMEKVYNGWRSVLGEGHPRTQEALLVLEKLRPDS